MTGSQGHWGQTCLRNTTSCTQTKQNQSVFLSFTQHLGHIIPIDRWPSCWWGIKGLTCQPLPVCRFGLAVRLVSRRALVRFHFSSLFPPKRLWSVDTVLWLSITINGTLKWFSSLPILMQESFGWRQYSDRYITSLPLSPPPFARP